MSKKIDSCHTLMVFFRKEKVSYTIKHTIKKEAYGDKVEEYSGIDLDKLEKLIKDVYEAGKSGEGVCIANSDHCETHSKTETLLGVK